MLLFQSSPNPKVGCYVGVKPLLDVVVSVSILTQPEGWVLLCLSRSRQGNVGTFQSSPNPKVGCYHEADHQRHNAPRVSILTQPEGWVLPQQQYCNPPCHRVSILTQPEGWVLP